MEGTASPFRASTPMAGGSVAAAGAPVRNSMANPVGIGAGAPVREFLNERFGGWVKRAMLAAWDMKPEYPLTYLGEYLITCDIKHNGSPATEAQKHFLYLSDGIPEPVQEPQVQSKSSTDETATAGTTTDTVMNGDTTTEMPDAAQDMEVKTEEPATTVPEEQQVNGVTAVDVTEQDVNGHGVANEGGDLEMKDE